MTSKVGVDAIVSRVSSTVVRLGRGFGAWPCLEVPGPARGMSTRRSPSRRTTTAVASKWKAGGITTLSTP